MSSGLVCTPQQSRHGSHAHTWYLLLIIFPGFPILFPKKAETLFSLLFVSYNTCFPPTYSKLTTITIQRATTVRLTATTSEHSLLELLWKHKYCWKSFLGISQLLTCSPGARDEEFSGQLFKWMKILTTVTPHTLSHLNLLSLSFKPLNITHQFCLDWAISLSKLHSLSKYWQISVTSVFFSVLVNGC